MIGGLFEDWQRQALAEVEAEVLADDPVVRNITYHRFVSKSKGRRNGKQRIRRHWKEVRLVSYRTGFQSWHRFPFDEYATEILGQQTKADEAEEALKQRIIDLWGF